MVQAAAEGIVDFSQARLADLRWHWRLGKLLGYLNRKNHREYLQLKHQEYTAALSRRLNQEDRLRFTELMWDLQDRFRRSFEPSVKLDDDQTSARSKLRDATSQWEAAFGKLDDPQVKQEIEKVAAGLDALRRQTYQQLKKLPPSLRQEAAKYRR